MAALTLFVGRPGVETETRAGTGTWENLGRHGDLPLRRRAAVAERMNATGKVKAPYGVAMCFSMFFICLSQPPLFMRYASEHRAGCQCGS